MQTTEAPQSSSGLLSGPYRQQLKKQKVEDQYYTIASNVPKNFLDDNINRTLFRAHAGQLFTLDSSPTVDCGVYGSPTTTTPNTTPTTTASFSPNWSALSSDNNTSGSPLSGSSGVIDGGNELTHMLRELENRLMGPASEMYNDTSSYSFTYLPDSEQSLSDAVSETSSVLTRWKRMREIAPSLDTKDLLNVCAEAVADADVATAEFFMGLLEKRVSVSGDPFQRLSAYLLEGLRARLLSSGSTIYKKLNCDEPTGPELMSYMQVLYHLCPYYKFAYVTSNAIIGEAVAHEARIHVIDFQVAQGSQWMLFIKALSQRPGGPPFFRLTGVDDPNSARARGGGLALVGERVAKFAASCGVPFEFHAAAISGSEVEPESLRVGPGEAVAVNFPYFLHHMPDEGVSTANHRDRLLRLVKGLSPRVVALVEQEANTNTAPFLPRFRETVDYYTAMFESIDGGAHPRDDRRRIGTEEHCVARDVVNLVACEGRDRVERHEVLGKWRMRMTMAGFAPRPLSPSVGDTMAQVLREYSPNYWMRESPEGALFLGWKARALSTCSAWR